MPVDEIRRPPEEITGEYSLTIIHVVKVSI
jgi:hypothetical protein